MAARMLMHGSSDINYPYASGMEVASVIHQYMMHNKLDDATRAALNSAFVVLTYPQTNVSVAGTGICKTTAVAPLIHRFSFRNEDITWHLCPICSTILKENDHPDENTQNCPRCNVNILWE